jgi:hypothetical protein
MHKPDSRDIDSLYRDAFHPLKQSIGRSLSQSNIEFCYTAVVSSYSVLGNMENVSELR